MAAATIDRIRALKRSGNLIHVLDWQTLIEFYDNSLTLDDVSEL